MKNEQLVSKVEFNKLNDEVSKIKYTYGVGIFNKLNSAINEIKTDYVIIVDDSILVSDDIVSKIEIKDYYVDTIPEVIELKYFDKFTGKESEPRTTSGFYRLDELFPKDSTEPYVSKLTIYKTEEVKYVLNSLGDKFPELMNDIDFVIQTLIFRLKENIDVKTLKDKAYGIYIKSETENRNPLVLIKSYKYITKLFKAIGLRRDYYSNYVKYTKLAIKEHKENKNEVI